MSMSNFTDVSGQVPNVGSAGMRNIGRRTKLVNASIGGIPGASNNNDNKFASGKRAFRGKSKQVRRANNNSRVTGGNISGGLVFKSLEFDGGLGAYSLARKGEPPSSDFVNHNNKVYNVAELSDLQESMYKLVLGDKLGAMMDSLPSIADVGALEDLVIHKQVTYGVAGSRHQCTIPGQWRLDLPVDIPDVDDGACRLDTQIGLDKVEVGATSSALLQPLLCQYPGGVVIDSAIESLYVRKVRSTNCCSLFLRLFMTAIDAISAERNVTCSLRDIDKVELTGSRVLGALTLSMDAQLVVHSSKVTGTTLRILARGTTWDDEGPRCTRYDLEDISMLVIDETGPGLDVDDNMTPATFMESIWEAANELGLLGDAVRGFQMAIVLWGRTVVSGGMTLPWSETSLVRLHRQSAMNTLISSPLGISDFKLVALSIMVCKTIECSAECIRQDFVTTKWMKSATEARCLSAANVGYAELKSSLLVSVCSWVGTLTKHAPVDLATDLLDCMAERTFNGVDCMVASGCPVVAGMYRDLLKPSGMPKSVELAARHLTNAAVDVKRKIQLHSDVLTCILKVDTDRICEMGTSVEAEVKSGVAITIPLEVLAMQGCLVSVESLGIGVQGALTLPGLVKDEVMTADPSVSPDLGDLTIGEYKDCSLNAGVAYGDGGGSAPPPVPPRDARPVGGEVKDDGGRENKHNSGSRLRDMFQRHARDMKTVSLSRTGNTNIRLRGAKRIPPATIPDTKYEVSSLGNFPVSGQLELRPAGKVDDVSVQQSFFRHAGVIGEDASLNLAFSKSDFLQHVANQGNLWVLDANNGTITDESETAYDASRLAYVVSGDDLMVVGSDADVRAAGFNPKHVRTIIVK